MSKNLSSSAVNLFPRAKRLKLFSKLAKFHWFGFIISGSIVSAKQK